MLFSNIKYSSGDFGKTDKQPELLLLESCRNPNNSVPYKFIRALTLFTALVYLSNIEVEFKEIGFLLGETTNSIRYLYLGYSISSLEYLFLTARL